MPAMTTTTHRRGAISSRIGGIAESATLAVDAKAKALKAAGRPVIGFGAGEPDFPTPPAIVAAAEAACADPRNHRYSPAAGLPELREAIAAKTLRDSGLRDHRRARCWSPTAASRPSTRRSPPCSTRATRCCCRRRTGPPTRRRSRWPAGVPVVVQCGPEADFLPSVEQLEAARTERTKVLLWCSPSNPTGAVASRELTEAVGRWAAENDVWVITDEIYEHLVYDGAEAVSMPVAVPELADRCVVLNGVAKTYAMTGWRVGWMAGPADVMKAATNLQSHLSSNVCNVAQRAALEAVSGSLDAVAEMRTRSTGGAGRSWSCSRRSPASSARPRGARSTPTRRCRRCSEGAARGAAADLGRAGRGGAGARRGGGGARRGVRHARVLPAVLRARRRRPAHRRQRMGALLAEARYDRTGRTLPRRHFGQGLTECRSLVGSAGSGPRRWPGRARSVPSNLAVIATRAMRAPVRRRRRR